MSQFEGGCVKEVTGQRQRTSGTRLQFTRRAVEYISDHGMSERGQMNANLVRAAGIDFYLKEREFAVRRVEPFLDRVVGDRFATALASGSHSDASYAVATDVGADRSVILFERAVDQGDVRFLGL